MCWSDGVSFEPFFNYQGITSGNTIGYLNTQDFVRIIVNAATLTYLRLFDSEAVDRISVQNSNLNPRLVNYALCTEKIALGTVHNQPWE